MVDEFTKIGYYKVVVILCTKCGNCQPVDSICMNMQKNQNLEEKGEEYEKKVYPLHQKKSDWYVACVHISCYGIFGKRKSL